MHQAAFTELHIPFTYLSFPVPPPLLSRAVHGLKALRARGVNVTVPYKERILPYLTDPDETVLETGSANTVLFEEERVRGYNTDIVGFQKAVEPHLPPKKELHVLLLGAGGTARAVLYALRRWRVATVTLVNRTPQRAKRIQRKLLAQAPLESFVCPLAKLKSAPCLAQCDLVVQTTPVGLAPHSASSIPFPFQALPPHCLVVDVIYNPVQTLFLRKARQRKLKTINGLSMLLYQGAEAFRLFTQKPAPIPVMARAIGLS